MDTSHSTQAIYFFNTNKKNNVNHSPHIIVHTHPLSLSLSASYNSTFSLSIYLLYSLHLNIHLLSPLSHTTLATMHTYHGTILIGPSLALTWIN